MQVCSLHQRSKVLRILQLARAGGDSSDSELVETNQYIGPSLRFSRAIVTPKTLTHLLHENPNCASTAAVAAAHEEDDTTTTFVVVVVCHPSSVFSFVSEKNHFLTTRDNYSLRLRKRETTTLRGLHLALRSTGAEKIVCNQRRTKAGASHFSGSVLQRRYVDVIEVAIHP